MIEATDIRTVRSIIEHYIKRIGATERWRESVQFHDHGYVSGDPRVQPAAGVGLGRPDELPDEVDVLIIGAGPAGLIAAAQLSQFPNVVTRIVERRDGRLEVGQADGIQARSVETFQAFGFAGRITEEAFRITVMAFWKPDPDDPSRIIRTAQPADDPSGISEFPHLLVNQARVQDYFAEFMAFSPSRMTPDYGFEFVGLEIDEEASHPVAVTLLHTAGAKPGQQRVVRAKYLVGCDGAKSAVRESIGRTLEGDQALHAWGVMDVLAVTDFPDIRTKCAIQSHDGGNILLIPREGGYLFRMYVDLGEVSAEDNGAVRETTIDQIIAKANQILHPYTLDVRSVAWHSVYEVGHRLTDRFDDVPANLVGTQTPRVFIAGDACHTHSAKAGQGMNVSMQDGFNIGWKLGAVLDGRSPESLLETYSAERQVIAKDLIDFDKQWSSLMATRQEELEDPTELERFYVKTFEFPAGFMTQYQPSLVIADGVDRQLAPGFPIGKRFKSPQVTRVCDALPVHLGHHAKADGRWRIYAFADTAAAGEPSVLTDFAEWIASAADSPIVAFTPADADVDAWFDLKVIYQQAWQDVDLGGVPEAFLPRTGEFGLIDYEKVYASDLERDVFEERGIDRRGVLVVVRPDQYVANVLPLSATAELAAFFAPIMTVRSTVSSGRK
jgi:phenol 2-monooxygenase